MVTCNPVRPSCRLGSSVISFLAQAKDLDPACHEGGLCANAQPPEPGRYAVLIQTAFTFRYSSSCCRPDSRPWPLILSPQGILTGFRPTAYPACAHVIEPRHVAHTLKEARLVVPGDIRGGRYVSDVVSIRLERALPDPVVEFLPLGP